MGVASGFGDGTLTESILRYADSLHVSLLDGTYRWLDAAQFDAQQVDSNPARLLSALLAHEQYVDHYATELDVAASPQRAAEVLELRTTFNTRATDRLGHPRAQTDDALPAVHRVHGPYLLDRVTLDAFQPCTGQLAETLILDWMGRDNCGQGPDVEGDLDGLLGIVRSFGMAYALNDLGTEAEHEFGWIVNPFLEIVGIDSARSLLWLVAGGGD
jgi:hypothetical protein